ncbi:GNAT family N-acetyltransferase [Metabacillus niabensis]|uniref:Ribosomal protein S18 acetylase RimI-like enzyme n=1 Tax=Metabacillus niabensis TaxID=324854 RepID=A0ABT9Z2N3_9BACI|nr:GNAT family N-acetyltransferase [Metabacillus niabensis]MDQ0225828.1 ribosomal protein S18 acetylase RimI-like enzyme [Metabacillus niabensis]
MIHFELNTIDKKHIEIDMMNSNPTYNLIAKGKEAIDKQDVEEEFRESVDLEVVRLFVIHKKYQGSGLAEKIYSQFETRILDKGKKIISLAVHEINVQGIQLWSSLGFRKI